MSPRLTSIDGLPDTVQRPAYRREDHGSGIVHIGLGAFHRAHQATYTDDALAAAGGDWRTIGVSLRSREPAQHLNPQNGLFTVIERDVDGTRARVVGALSNVIAMTEDRRAVLNALSAPSTRIVSITVTERGYGIDRATGAVDSTHPAVAADLANPASPHGVAGLLVWALGQREAAGVPPFAVLSCDNLPDNGKMLRRLLVDFAARAAPALVSHIENDVPFPSTMVDRITPAPSAATAALAAQLVGRRDEAAVETEAFRQWVIEDAFPAGRPAWDAGGAIFATDVAPYESMKLRMLNGAHSMLAYAGFLCGHETVRDVMGDPDLVALIRRHLAAAGRTLQPVRGIDFKDYGDDLLRRFANPNLRHQTHQIASDGTQKMPQRIFRAGEHAIRDGQPIDAFAFATAAWLRYAMGRDEQGTEYDVRDDVLPTIAAANASADDVLRIAEGIGGVIPTTLTSDETWRLAVKDRLAVMLDGGMRAALQKELAVLA